MVSKVEVCNCNRPKMETMKKKQQQQQEVVLQCNKGKSNRFKRSSFSGEEDPTASAILLLACLACAPPSA